MIFAHDFIIFLVPLLVCMFVLVPLRDKYRRMLWATTTTTIPDHVHHHRLSPSLLHLATIRTYIDREDRDQVFHVMDSDSDCRDIPNFKQPPFLHTNSKLGDSFFSFSFFSLFSTLFLSFSL